VVGSTALLPWIGQIAFWALLMSGWFLDELGVRGIAVFVFLWLSGFFGLPFLSNGAALFSPLVAVLDIALVLTIFKGDIRLH
jgi:hypothetical protein